jgi:hypothetical protein
MPKKKPKTIAKLVDEAATLLQKYVRLKAADENGYAQCVTCGVIKHWKELQGGHFISRRWTATKLIEENVNPQCPRCNGPLGGDLIEYTRYMDEMYGPEFVDELRQLKHQTKKYTRAEVEEIKAELREKIKELEGWN